LFRHSGMFFRFMFLVGFKGCVRMSKTELIECICEINRSAKPEFLADFSEEDLSAYLEHLMELDLQELTVFC